MAHYFFRPVGGKAGGCALAVRDNADSEEQLFALFAESRWKDIVPCGEDRCLALSSKGDLALVNLEKKQVVKRSKRRIYADKLVVAADGSRGIAYTSNTICVLNMDELEPVVRYNLIRQREDGLFDLLSKDHDTLEAEGTPWHSLPKSDGPLREETREGDPFLRHAPATPNGLRRMALSLRTKGVFRADGKVVLRFGFSKKKIGPSWKTYPDPESKSVRRTSLSSVGVAVLDLETERGRFDVLSSLIKNKSSVRSFSPDGMHAIVSSHEPVQLPSTGEATPDCAMALEVWEIGEKPQLRRVIPYQLVAKNWLLPKRFRQLHDDKRPIAAKQIDLIFPGIAANYAQELEDWRKSSERQREDEYFAPIEADKRQRTSYESVHDPALFADTLKRLVELAPAPFSRFDWGKAEPRQCRFFEALLDAWGDHSLRACEAIYWTSSDQFTVISLRGSARRISIDGRVGPAFEMSLVAGARIKSSGPGHQSINVEQGPNGYFEVELGGVGSIHDCFGYTLPDEQMSVLEANDRLGMLIPTFDRRYNAKERGALLQRVDRMTEKIRRGYIKVKDRKPASIIKGLKDLSSEITNHFDEVVVDHRWVPALHCRGKRIIEGEFCDILVENGGADAIAALDGFLTSYLSALGDRAQNVWHHNDLTPTMGPVTMALIQLCDTIPPSVWQFYARRDMNHDGWTHEAFEDLSLSKKRLLSADLVALQIRLGIQDICTQNVDPDLFALYRLPLVREAMREDPSLVPSLADTILSQAQQQSPEYSWSSNWGVDGMLEAIVSELDQNQASQRALGKELMRKADEMRAEEA